MSEEIPFTDLVQGVRQGNQEAAAELVRRYEPAIRRVVRFRMHDSRLNAIFDSMDICQSVLASFFIRAASGEYEMSSPEGIMQLLIAMTKKKLAMQVRRQQAQRRDNRRLAAKAVDEVPLADGASPPSKQVAAREMLQQVHARLSDEERQIVTWRSEGIEWAEIASRLNTTAEAIRKKFARAIDRVAVELGIDEE